MSTGTGKVISITCLRERKEWKDVPFDTKSKAFAFHADTDKQLGNMLRSKTNVGMSREVLGWHKKMETLFYRLKNTRDRF